MERGSKFQEEHIAGIFKEYTTPSRVLRSFTNLSNTVIQTALSGQSKFVFEILQNADDAFENEHKPIEIKFLLHDNFLIVQHDGKGFDFNDVERICDYASQIEEVKATDLSKTGYKGLGFKSLFNLSDCIYIYSNGYSFRFDKTYWPDWETKPWQIIPIWCNYDELPLNQKCPYDQPVNLIMRVNNVNLLQNQLKEVVNQPELLLYLYRISKFNVNLNGVNYFLERKVESYGVFTKIDFYKNHHIESTWLTRTYKRPVDVQVQIAIQGASRFIYPDKIKRAKEVLFTFTLQTDDFLKEVSKVRGLCFSTLPTQLHLALPYHINGSFILNLDRTQLHENEWNKFLMHQIGYLQINFLEELAKVDYLKNYVIELFVREIDHPYGSFNEAFVKGFNEAKGKIGWLPAIQGSRLLKLGEAWTDETKFFEQNFQNVWDPNIFPLLIDYAVKGQKYLFSSEVKRFTYDQLFQDFAIKYYRQLTSSAYTDFISFLYKQTRNLPSNDEVIYELKNTPFLLAKDRMLLSPSKAVLVERENLVPDFLMLNTIENKYLPLNNTDLTEYWLVSLGAKRLTTPAQILRETILKWIDSDTFHCKIKLENHIGVINYLKLGVDELTNRENEKLKEKLLVLTESKKFKLANSCFFHEVVCIKEFSNIISDDEKISSCYDMTRLRRFFIQVGVKDKLEPIEVFRKSILMWIQNNKINNNITLNNYKPIIEFAALHYPALRYYLTESEKRNLNQMPVLTCDQIFQKAEVCYFDSAALKIKGLEDIIGKNELVCTNNISEILYEFLQKLGVSKKIAPLDVIRRSILRWIQENKISKKITLENHQAILAYISKHWDILTTGLEPDEKTDMKRMPILTEGNVFQAASSCYWSVSNSNYSSVDKIPGLEAIISSCELVSSTYDLNTVGSLFISMGVRNLTFTSIYEKYSGHLNHSENVKWFFTQLVKYWNGFVIDAIKDKLLNFLKKKFSSSSCLLAKNDKIYTSTELYSSCFDKISFLDKNTILLLQYEKLPIKLEKYLGFKTDLEFECIKQLLSVINKKTDIGEENTRVFFSTLLEQLRERDINEIKKQQLSLLSQENKLILAEDLYYFNEEDKKCLLNSCYLKRIHGMSHKETLELAKLCGVNVLPFNIKIMHDPKKYDNSLKEFYLERLPFIVVQEAKELNENVSDTLIRFYERICSITLYECNTINVKYSFGDPVKVQDYFEELICYVVGNWSKKRSKIHDYLAEKLGFKTDIRDIRDMDNPQDDKEEWPLFQKEKQKFCFVEQEIEKILSRNENEKINVPIFIDNVDDAQSPHSELKENVCRNDKIVVNEELTAAELLSADKSSVDHVEEKFGPEKQCVVKSKDCRVNGSSLSELEVIAGHDTTNNNSLVKEDAIEADTRGLIPQKLDIKSKLIKQPEIPNSFLSSNERPHGGSLSISHVVSSEKSSMKWQMEKHVFRSLQEFYKENYPQSQFNLSERIFMLWGQSHHIEIVWLNVNGEQDDSCNLVLIPAESITIARPHHSEYKEETFRDNDILVNKEELGAAESFLPSKSLEDYIKVDLHLPKQSKTKYKENRICSTSTTEPEHHARYEATTHSKRDEDIIEVDIKWLVHQEFEIDSKKHRKRQKISGIYYHATKNLHTGSFKFSQEANSEISHTKCPREKYVYTFLQEYYQNEYPNSEFNLSDKTFILGRQSHKIEIDWLNAIGEEDHLYDLMLTPVESVKFAQSHHSECEEKNIRDKLSLNKEMLAGTEPLLTDKSLLEHVKTGHHSQEQCTIQMKNRGVNVISNVELEVNLRHEAIIDPIIDKNIIQVETRWLVRQESENDCKKRMEWGKIPGSYFSSIKSLHTAAFKFSKDITCEKSYVKWLGEKYVFSFLQNYYKNKYPSSQYSLSERSFMIRGQSHTIEIVWLNACEEKGQLYDLLLKKEGEIKRLIEVKLNNVENNESFHINNHKFIQKMNQLAAETPEHKEKYCIYYILNTNISSQLSIEELNISAALYKVVALKIP